MAFGYQYNAEAPRVRGTDQPPITSPQQTANFRKVRNLSPYKTADALVGYRMPCQRHKIENFFCRIKDWRRIATRYDKLARNFLAATTLVGVLYWIKL